jgi:hypothetical protein
VRWSPIGAGAFVALRALEGLVGELDSAGLATPAIRGFLIQGFTRLGALDQAYALANHSLDNCVREGWNGGVWPLWGPEMRAFAFSSLRHAPEAHGVGRHVKLDPWRHKNWTPSLL